MASVTPCKARHCKKVALPLAMGMAGPRWAGTVRPLTQPSATPMFLRRYATNGALFPTGIAGMHSFMWPLQEPTTAGALGAPKRRVTLTPVKPPPEPGSGMGRLPPPANPPLEVTP